MERECCKDRRNWDPDYRCWECHVVVEKSRLTVEALAKEINYFMLNDLGLWEVEDMAEYLNAYILDEGEGVSNGA
jgi:hypothetical protein